MIGVSKIRKNQTMKKIIFVLIVIGITTILIAQERREAGNLVIENIPEIPKTVFERLDQYQNVRSASFSDWEPSGNGMLISTRFADTNQIHHVSSPGMHRKQMTFFREPVTTAVFPQENQPKGYIFQMNEGGGEFEQLYWFDLKEGTSRLLTDGGKSVNSFVLFSNSGNQAVYHSTKRNSKDYDLWLMNPLQPESERMVKEVSGFWAPLDWSADDKKILVMKYVSANESYLYEMDASSGELTQINPSEKKIRYDTASYARDRSGIYYVSDEDSEFYRLTFWNPDTKKKQVLVEMNWDIELVVVSLDGKWIAFSSNEAGISKLHFGAANDPNSAKVVDLPAGVISKLKFDRQSKRLAFNLSSADSPSDVYSLDTASRKVERWTFSETGGIDSSKFIEPQLIKFPSFDSVDGKARMIPAFYYKPKATANQKHPVLISIHGGPESQAKAAFSSNFQYWVNELGLAVLVPNVRGSSGFGKSYLQLDNGDKRLDSVKDIGALLDWIATQPELDSKRVAVYGGSYGGFMVLSSLIQFGERIRCGIDVVGISSFVTFLESTEIYRRDLRRAEYGDERDPKMREFLNSISPLTNSTKIKSPLFVVQGKNDPRVPFTEAEQIVKSVRSQGNTVWYLMAKDEGHGFAKKTNRDYQAAAMTLFLQQFLLK